MVVQAATLLDEGDAARADLLLDTHLRRHPTDPVGLAFHAQARLALGQGDEALDLARRAVVLAPDAVPCLVALGATLLNLDVLSEAEAQFRAALSLAPTAEQAVEGLMEILKRTGRAAEVGALLDAATAAAPDRAVFHQQLAHHYRAMGDSARALDAARRAVSLDEGNAHSWWELGVCLFSQDREGCIQALERAHALGNDSSELWNILGITLGHLDRREEAREAFRRSIARAPDSPRPWTNLGNLETRGNKEERDLEAGVTAYREALARASDSHEIHNNLALALRDLNRMEEAIGHARRALALRPDDTVVINTLANLLRTQGETEEARVLMERAVALCPESPENHANLGLVLMVERDLEAAEHHLRIAAEAPNTTVNIQLNLVQFLAGQHRQDEADAILETIFSKHPDHVRARMSQALLAFNQDRYERAEDIYRTLLKTHPTDWNIRFSLGVTLWSQRRMVDALDIAQDLFEEKPTDPGLLNLIGCCANDVLDSPQANAYFRRAVDACKPGQGADFLSNLCFNAHYGPSMDREALFALHREWDQRFGAAVMEPGPPHDNDRNPDRRLKIGYVSPDFRRHSVAYFILPVIANHDRAQFEVTCYSYVAAPDTVTALIRENADHWRNVVGMDPHAVADLARRDGIDILVDLAGHTGNNALAVFARKPAPVQVTYLGYPNTTGLSAMDWRLTDIHADPPPAPDTPVNMVDPMSETPYRLPRSFLLFRPADDIPHVTPPPVLEKGHITFGSFNNLSKLSPTCLRTWAEILEAVPNSRLLLKAKVLRDPATRDRVRQVLGDWGIDMTRVDLVSYAKTLIDHMATYGQVDIALDTFPYNGTTTTFEALHMGVPVMGCVGPRHSARVGASILTNLGLADELLGTTAEDMRDKAVALAGNWERLTVLRATLRDLLRSSPCRQTMSFMADLDAAYRDMWRRWTAGPPTHGFRPSAAARGVKEAEDAITPGP